MKLILTLVLFCCLIIPVFADEIITLKDAPITEQSFMLKEESKSEIIIKEPPATLTVTPFLSSGVVKASPVDIKELPIDQVVTSLVTSVRSGVTKTKVVQIYPESVLQISPSTETVMQTKVANDPKVELYYEYQKSIQEPWKYYYKVEKCGSETCRVVRADFAERKVWIEYIPVATANGLVSETIPAYDALPNGVRL